ncbi:MAG: hypothetical protein VKO21_07325 [Candidatus Sericytochromatia bacterium]|nr:hypothetical protein [Candidatus Sericytochromatia bacterium]
MRFFSRLVGFGLVLLALLSVRNADSVCPRICLHEAAAHSCSWTGRDSFLAQVARTAQGVAGGEERPELEEALLAERVCQKLLFVVGADWLAGKSLVSPPIGRFPPDVPPPRLLNV